MSTNRLTLKQGSMMARQRQTQKNRLTRHSCFTLKRQTGFHLRKSMVDYVDDELRKMDTSVFYQRIYILAKNIQPGQRSIVAPPTANQLQIEEARTSVNTQLTAGSIASDTEAVIPVVEINAENITSEYADDNLIEGDDSTNVSSPEGSQMKATNLNEDDLETEVRGNSEPSAGVQNTGGEMEVLTHTYRFDEEENALPEEEIEEEPLEESFEELNMSKDFYGLFTDRLQELHKKCISQTFTPDPMCGLFLYMGDYSMLMLESGEDMMGVFCNELVNCSSEFWSNNRVFLIEDRIKELYTRELISRRIPAAFINEKFPTSTPTDEYLMGKQHMIIKEKILTICRMITETLRQETRFEPSSQNSSDEDDDLGHRSSSNAVTSKSEVSNMSDALPVDTYRKLLPEIQRIDLVLSSTRFYYTLSEFTNIYGQSPIAADDDSLFWPIQNQYTPPSIFMRTPFDINMTFADYAAEMVRRKEEEKLEQQMGPSTIEDGQQENTEHDQDGDIKEESQVQAPSEFTS